MAISERCILYLYRFLLLLLLCCLAGIAYVVYSESIRVSHAVVSPFSEMLKRQMFWSAIIAVGFLSLSSIFAVFEFRKSCNFFVILSEISTAVLEILTCIVMLVIVYRLEGDNVGQQLIDLLLSFLA